MNRFFVLAFVAFGFACDPPVDKNEDKGPGAGDYSIALSPSTLTIPAGQSAMTNISVTLVSGEPQVTFVSVGTPAGITAEVQDVRIGSGTSNWMKVSVAANVSAGTYFLPIFSQNESGTASHSVTLNVEVTNSQQTNDYTLALSQNAITLQQGTTGNVTVNSAFTSGAADQTIGLSFTSNTNTISGSFNPSSVRVGNSSILSVSVGNTPVGTYPITVSSTNGSVTRTQNLSVTVTSQPAADDHSLFLNVSSITIPRGLTASVIVSTGWLGGSTSQQLSLSLSSPVNTLTGSFNPVTVTVGQNSILTLATDATNPGSYTVTVISTHGTVTRSQTLTVIVEQSALNYSISLTPSTISVAPGSSASVTVGATLVSGSDQVVTLSTGTLPAGIGVTFSAPTVNTGFTQTANVTVAGNVTPGTYNVQVNGTSGQLVRTANLSVNVVNPVSCSAGQACATGQICGANLTCIVPGNVPPNGSCTQSSQCLSGLCLGNNLCAYPPFFVQLPVNATVEFFAGSTFVERRTSTGASIASDPLRSVTGAAVSTIAGCTVKTHLTNGFVPCTSASIGWNFPQ